MRKKTCLILLVAAMLLALPLAAQADYVYQTINGTFQPGPYIWAGGNNIGWYWTPATDVTLTGIQTKLTTGFTNINNNYTFTAAVYTDRPSVGGTLLGSFDFNGTNYINGPWLGGSFASPVHLTGGTTYFLGFTGWAAAYKTTEGAGVMMAADSNGNPYTGEEFLDGWFGANSWNQNFASNSWPDGAILQFVAQTPTPLPGGLLLLGAGIARLAFYSRRRKLAASS